jgi:zinc protease
MTGRVLLHRPSFRAALVFCLMAASIPAAGQEKFRKSPPIPDPLPGLRLPPIESAVLSNGLTVAVARKSAEGLVSIQLVIMAGEGDCSASRPGVAAVTAGMIGRGTDTLSSGEIEDRIEAVGGDLTMEVSIDQTVFTLDVLEENLDRALEVLGQIFIHASFSEKSLDAVKRTLYYDLLEREKDPEFLAKRQLFRLLFKGHPYSVSAYTEDAIQAIAQPNVLSFYDRYYRPNNAVLVLAGDMNLSVAARKVSHSFNTWIEKRLDRPFLAGPAPAEEEKIAFIHQAGARDITIITGNPIFPIASPDYFPFLVLNQILGGSTGSRLFMTLRESKGLAYYSFSGMDFYRSCGVFWVKAKVTPESLVESIDEIFKLLGSQSIERITSFEIEQAKSFLIGNFPLKNESLTNFSRKVSLIKAYNLGDDHWNKYYENLILVNLDKVLETARRYVQPRPPVVIVGDLDQASGHFGTLLDRIEFYDVKGQLRSDINKGVDK